MDLPLFGSPTTTVSPSVPTPRGLDANLSQWFTPTWAAEALVAAYFPDLGPRDYVIEPSCGHGAFLGAIPHDVPAIGIELDPKVAEEARRLTARDVLQGDFRTIELPGKPTAIIGNPPFEGRFWLDLLDRATGLMDDGGKIGLVLPCYKFQTPSTVMGVHRHWSIFQEMIPRTLFQGSEKPLCFAIFTKDRVPVMQGFALYAEALAVEKMNAAYREILERAPRSAWVQCVATAIRQLGGKATLDQLYREIGGRRPSETRWWREKVRQVAGRYLTRLDEATYALAS